MSRSLLFLLLCACSNSDAPISLTVRVFDASSGAPLCDATVTIDSVAAVAGKDAASCYFVSQQNLASHSSVPVSVTKAGFQTSNVVVPIHADESPLMNLIIELLPN